VWQTCYADSKVLGRKFSGCNYSSKLVTKIWDSPQVTPTKDSCAKDGIEQVNDILQRLYLTHQLRAL
jgi:hypothetical protein